MSQTRDASPQADPTGSLSPSHSEDRFNRLKWTYLARLEGSKRLKSCDTAISSGMVLFNLASVLSAIRLLNDTAHSYWPTSPYTSIALAIIALVLSLYSATADYGRRAQRMFENYREIQKLWAQTETVDTSNAALVKKIMEKYDDQLDGHENHTSADYRINRSSKRRSERSRKEGEHSWIIGRLNWLLGRIVWIIPGAGLVCVCFILVTGYL